MATPLMVPELEWEVFGDVDNVVFVQGAHVDDDGDTITLVYGAADRHVGAARASIRHLLELLRSDHAADETASTSAA